MECNCNEVSAVTRLKSAWAAITFFVKCQKEGTGQNWIIFITLGIYLTSPLGLNGTRSFLCCVYWYTQTCWELPNPRDHSNTGVNNYTDLIPVNAMWTVLLHGWNLLGGVFSLISNDKSKDTTSNYFPGYEIWLKEVLNGWSLTLVHLG